MIWVLSWPRMISISAGRKKPGWRGVVNIITLFRVVFTCVVNYYILTYFGRVMLPFLLFGLIFFTDYLDGKIARRYGVSSPGGAVFDLLADFFFIFLSYLVLQAFMVIPFWLVCVVCGKFAEFILTSFFLKKYSTGNGNQVFVFDFLGRFVAVVFYLFPMLSYISYQSSPAVHTFCVNTLGYIILFCALLSSAYRIGKCFRRQR